MPDAVTEDEYRFEWSDAYWQLRDQGFTTTAATIASDAVMAYKLDLLEGP